MNTYYKKSILAGVLAAVMTTTAYAMEPSSHLEHPHSAGTVMVEYKFMRMYMNGLMKGTEDISTEEAKSAGYERIPETMTMDMNMLMPMYNISKELSVMAMMTYVSNAMDMQMKMTGMNMYHAHEMSTSGLGDTELSLSYKNSDFGVAGTLVLSIPTGSTSETVTMSNVEMPAPFAMQLGSGTYDITPVLTYLGAYYETRYGAQLSYTYRMDENDEGYTLGNQAKAMAWVRKPVGSVVLDAKLAYKRWGDIDGVQKGVMPGATTLSNTEMTSVTHIGSNYGGTAVNANVGVVVPVAMTNIGLDLGMPVYQNLNGIQMKQGWNMTVSVAAMF